LLDRARAHFRAATLLCAMHDVQATEGFPRVLVLDQGRIVEDGEPGELMLRAGGHYVALLEAERQAEARWRAPQWHRLEMRDGRLSAGASR
jgi:ATP-binding cassette subfamily B protein